MPKTIRTWLLKPVVVLAALGLSGTALLAVAGAASASTTFTATTSLTNRPDSGNNTMPSSRDWATDTLTRTATLVDDGPDSNKPGYDTYSFSLADTGTFVTISGAGNPDGLNPSVPITGTVTGTVTGSGTWSNFDVPSFIHPSTGGVPASQDGAGTPSSDWLQYFFPKDTPITCPGIKLTAYSDQVVSTCGTELGFDYVYNSCSEQWRDANTDNDGNAVGADAAELAVIGGISGAACPAPSPTPSSSVPPVTGTVPVGGVQTGGGQPDTSALMPVGITAAVLGVLILAFAFAVSRRRQRG